LKALILGNLGQVGSALEKHLIESGHEVCGLDLPFFDLRHRANRLWLTRRIEENDFIYFLAFDVGGSNYLAKHQSSVKFIENNIEIMLAFIKAYSASNNKPPFIFASSQMSNMNWSQYGVLKRIGEFITNSLGGINIRFWNVYGNETNPEKFHVITDFLNAAISGNDIVMRTSGQEQRQMLHAKDASIALETLALRFNELDKSKYYDITSFDWISIREIAQIIAFIYGVNFIPNSNTDDVQKDFGNEPSEEILKYWNPTIEINEGILMVAKEIERLSN
jgi:nucleoside-diphosphate-sugar epimerase